ncbi:MAG: hypothetical protein QNI86_08970 [Halieaceae bacterium]|nr:hypothetical protein [Halieaceae bacterium]
MREHEVTRCAHCRGELRASWRVAGGPRMLALAVLLLVMGIGLMALSPPQPVLAVPATVLLAAALALLLRREYQWVCEHCPASAPEECAWLERQKGVSI